MQSPLDATGMNHDPKFLPNILHQHGHGKLGMLGAELFEVVNDFLGQLVRPYGQNTPPKWNCRWPWCLRFGLSRVFGRADLSAQVSRWQAAD